MSRLPGCGQGVPFRVIAARLGCSLGSVQKAVRRVQARRGERVLAASADVDVEPAWPLRSDVDAWC
jgi:lambda repressor-like predicted transcriptional regulator